MLSLPISWTNQSPWLGMRSSRPTQSQRCVKIRSISWAYTSGDV